MGGGLGDDGQGPAWPASSIITHCSRARGLSRNRSNASTGSRVSPSCLRSRERNGLGGRDCKDSGPTPARPLVSLGKESIIISPCFGGAWHCSSVSPPVLGDMARKRLPAACAGYRSWLKRILQEITTAMMAENMDGVYVAKEPQVRKATTLRHKQLEIHDSMLGLSSCIFSPSHRAYYLSKASSNGNLDKTSMPVSVIRTCSSSFTP